MTYTYSLTSGPFVLRSDGAFIPSDPANMDWQTYQMWLATGNIPTPRPSPTLAQQAAAISSVAVVSSSTSTLNGNYGCDPASLQRVANTLSAIAVNLSFATTTIPWPDTSGTPHTFSVAQFKSLAQTLLLYEQALASLMAGASGSLPTVPLTIP